MIAMPIAPTILLCWAGFGCLCLCLILQYIVTRHRKEPVTGQSSFRRWEDSEVREDAFRGTPKESDVHSEFSQGVLKRD